MTCAETTLPFTGRIKGPKYFWIAFDRICDGVWPHCWWWLITAWILLIMAWLWYFNNRVWFPGGYSKQPSFCQVNPLLWYFLIFKYPHFPFQTFYIKTRVGTLESTEMLCCSNFDSSWNFVRSCHFTNKLMLLIYRHKFPHKHTTH